MRAMTTMSMRGLELFGLMALGLALAAAGCSGKTTKQRSSSGGAVKIGEVDADSAITTDGGRISIRSPAGWARGPRSDDYVIRYTPGPQKTFPAIVVTAGDPPAGITEVTADNQKEFVEAVTEQLAATFSRDGKSTLSKKPAAVTLGEHRGVAWTAPGTAKVGGMKQPIERSCVAIVFANRMYTVEARAPKGKLDDTGRAAARGVAAGIAGPVAEESPAAPLGGEEPKTEEPAAAEPKAEEPAAAAESP
ncbi:MAG: hypothetical protein K8S94_00510 [Planctomycetia bacterium]|nr:hypothetical protein [Planctomycetia bacterium]